MFFGEGSDTIKIWMTGNDAVKSRKIFFHNPSLKISPYQQCIVRLEEEIAEGIPLGVVNEKRVGDGVISSKRKQSKMERVDVI